MNEANETRPASLEDRIQRLERQTRRLKLLVYCLVAVILAMVLVYEPFQVALLLLVMLATIPAIIFCTIWLLEKFSPTKSQGENRV